jgi:hypothetical protein
MQSCKNCQTENSDLAKFCKKCGQSLVVIICPHCHKENDQDAIYCQDCGRSLKDLSKADNIATSQFPNKIQNEYSDLEEQKSSPKLTNVKQKAVISQLTQEIKPEQIEDSIDRADENWVYDKIIGSKLHLEIDFFDEYSASILVTSNPSHYIYGELLLFISFTLQQLHNLKDYGKLLAEFLVLYNSESPFDLPDYKDDYIKRNFRSPVKLVE